MRDASCGASSRRSAIPAKSRTMPTRSARASNRAWLSSDLARAPGLRAGAGFRVSWKRRLLRFYIRAAVPGYLGTIAIVTAMILALPLLHAHETGHDRKRTLAPRLARRSACLGPGDCTDQPRRDGFAWTAKAAANGVAPRHPGRLANDRRRAHAADHRPRKSKSRSSGWKFITSQIPTETCASRCSPIGWMHRAKPCRKTTICSRRSRRHCAAEPALWSGPGGGERFFLFHRKRVWNESEGKWMGWERKRGKLHELNQLLRGSKSTTFMSIGGLLPANLSRRSLRHHARCRYAPAARRCRASGRHDGASSQSA